MSIRNNSSTLECFDSMFRIKWSRINDNGSKRIEIFYRKQPTTLGNILMIIGSQDVGPLLRPTFELCLVLHCSIEGEKRASFRGCSSHLAFISQTFPKLYFIEKYYCSLFYG